MIPYQWRARLYQLLKPLADRLYLWLKAVPANSDDVQSEIIPGHVREITSLEALDAELLEVDKAFAISDDAGRARLSSWIYRPNVVFPFDPYSLEYSGAQMAAYLELSGRSAYDVASSEHTAFDLEAAKRKPYPYFTHSPNSVGNQLILQGAVIRSLDLPVGSTVVEYGPGWGNLTMHLALMGYSVTAVEIEADFVQLIEHRAKQLGVQVDLVQSDMLDYRPKEPVDCALFFESFHHCVDHHRLLRNLEQVVKPSGMLVFGAEPIGNYPYPWGFVRNDGLTIWSIRKQGWFELGFDTSYFLRTLLRFGWLPLRTANAIVPGAEVTVARRAHGHYQLDKISLPPDEAGGWHGPEQGFRYTRGKAVLSCELDRCVRNVRLAVRNTAPHPVPLTIGVGSTRQTSLLPPMGVETTLSLDVQNWDGQVAFESPTWQPDAVCKNGDKRILGVAVQSVDIQ